MTFDSNVQFRVALGRNIGTTSQVSDSELTSFLSDVVSARFQGFAVTQGFGYWQGKPEASVFIDIISEDTAETRNSLSLIAAEYNTRFSQDCVLVTRQHIGANFASLRLSEAIAA